MTTALAVKTDGKGKPTVTQTIIMDQTEFEQAKANWQTIKESGQKRRELWFLIGKVIADYKAEYLGKNGKAIDNISFGKWTNEHFPGLRSDLISYAIKYAENKDEVDKWATINCPDLATPAHLMKKFIGWKNAQGKPRTPTAAPDANPKAADKTKVTAPDGTPETLTFQDLDKEGKVNLALVADTLHKGIYMLIDRVKGGHKLQPASRARLLNDIEALKNALKA